jgi:hypothetical protein
MEKGGHGMLMAVLMLMMGFRCMDGKIKCAMQQKV